MLVMKRRAGESFTIGDEIEIEVAGEREFLVSRDQSREKALKRIRKLRRPLPAGFKFDRLEANERR